MASQFLSPNEASLHELEVDNKLEAVSNEKAAFVNTMPKPSMHEMQCCKGKDQKRQKNNSHVFNEDLHTIAPFTIPL